jgi:hypothetical protein
MPQEMTMNLKNAKAPMVEAQTAKQSLPPAWVISLDGQFFLNASVVKQMTIPKNLLTV